MAHDKLKQGTCVVNHSRAGEPSPNPVAKNWTFLPRPVAWVVLLISLLASLGGWLIAREHAKLAASKKFDEAAGRIAAALSERMLIYEDVLHGAVGLFAASYSVERGEWRNYLESVSIESRFPGIDGVGFVAVVPRQQLDQFLSVTRTNDPGFQLKDAGGTNDLLVTKYMEPESRHRALVGMDLGLDPVRRTVAEQARDTGKAALSGSILLHDQGRQEQPGLLMLLPVYRHEAPLITQAERRAALQGWVFARFVTSHLMQAVLGPQNAELHLRVIDETAAPSGRLIFDQNPQLTQRRTQDEALFSTKIPLEYGGRIWTLNIDSTPPFESANRRGASVWVGAIGGVFSLLLFGIACSLSHTRERALAIAADMTRTLRSTNEQLESEIAERERSEVALRTSESLYHSLVESLPLSIARKDLQGRFSFANQRFCSDLDKPLDELLGKTEADFFPPGLAREREQFDRKVLETGVTLQSVEEHSAPDGSKRFVQAIRTPVYDGAKAVVGLLGIFWDVTDRHRAETELEHERYLLRTLMDNVPERIYFKDRASRFLRNNRAHLHAFGLDRPEEAVGKSDFDFFSVEHAQQAYQDEQRVMATGEAITKEERETWPDGSVTWVLTTKMPMRDEHGRIIGTFGISRNITDRKRAEEAMLLAKEAAEETSRTKSQFLASMSHELRTPLNSVIGFANILLKNKSGSLSVSEMSFLERILANGKHLLALINEILDLSKIEAHKVELNLSSVSLDALVERTLAEHESLVRDKPVRLVSEVPPDLAPIMTDPDKLRQVLINLLGNALKFTEEGTVTVRVLAEPAERRPIGIEVIDTGIGIPRDKLHVIFEAFQQGEVGMARKYGGTGLGLTISQALCRLMGYTIEATSEPGRGSTFTVHLLPGAEHPADRGPEPARATAAIGTSAKKTGLEGKTVLVIDDESDSRTLLSHAIEELGCRVLTAASGEQGLRMARAHKPDAITVDLMMPDLDGWQVIRALKAEPVLSPIPVVVVSILAAENRGRVLGVVDVLQKPVNREELSSVLRRCLLPDHPRVLIIDDDADSRRLLSSQLEAESCEIQTATSGREGLEMLRRVDPDLILLDLLMPQMDGMTFLNQLRSTPAFRFVPVVIVTAKDLAPAEIRQLSQMAQAVVQKGNHLEPDLEAVLKRLLLRRGESQLRI